MPWIATYVRGWTILLFAIFVEAGTTVDVRWRGCFYLGLVALILEWHLVAHLYTDVLKKTGVRIVVHPNDILQLALAGIHYVGAHLIIATMEPWTLRFTCVCILGAAHMAYHHIAIDNLLEAAANRVRDQKCSELPRGQ